MKKKSFNINKLFVNTAHFIKKKFFKCMAINRMLKESLIVWWKWFKIIPTLHLVFLFFFIIIYIINVYDYQIQISVMKRIRIAKIIDIIPVCGLVYCSGSIFIPHVPLFVFKTETKAKNIYHFQMNNKLFIFIIT